VKRGGYIKRHARLKARRGRKRRVDPSRVRSEEHKAAVRRLKCVSRNMPGARCKGVIEASHNDYDGTKGAGLKTSDLTCVPQCSQCHRDVARLEGPWKGWTGELRAEWFAAATALTLHMLTGPRPPAEVAF